MVCSRLMLVAAGLWLGAATAAHATIVYDSLPTTTAQVKGTTFYNLSGSDSSGSYSLVTSEFGDAIQIAGTNFALQRVTVQVSSSARQSDYSGVGTAAGFTVPLTLTLYQAAGTDASAPTPGAIIARVSNQAETFSWNPAGSDAVNKAVTFNFAGVTLPTSKFIVGLAFNAASGPASEMGFVLSTHHSVGTDLNLNSVEWGYTDRETDTSGTTTTTTVAFSPDSGTAADPNYWSEQGAPALRVEVVTPTVTTVPEPASLLLVATAVPLLRLARRRAKPAA